MEHEHLGAVVRIQEEKGWEVDSISWDHGTTVHLGPGDMGLYLPVARCVTPRRTNSFSVRRANNTFFMELLRGSDEIRCTKALCTALYEGEGLCLFLSSPSNKG